MKALTRVSKSDPKNSLFLFKVSVDKVTEFTRSRNLITIVKEKEEQPLLVKNQIPHESTHFQLWMFVCIKHAAKKARKKEREKDTTKIIQV